MLGKNCPRARGSGSFLTLRIKTLLFAVKHLLINSQARITLKEILKRSFLELNNCNGSGTSLLFV